MSITSKRTRSRLAVQDDILQLPLSRSPLKDARSAFLNHSQRHSAPPPDLASDRDDMEVVGDSEEDEILLSPHKKQKIGPPRARAKRSSSPLADRMNSTNPGGGREHKRRRRDSNSSEALHKPSHDTRDAPAPTASIISTDEGPAAYPPTSVSGAFSVDPTLLMTPTPFGLPPWPEMSPLTPLLETPFTNRTDHDISNIKLACFDTPRTPTEEQPPMAVEASTEPPPSEAGPMSHLITESASSGQSMLPRPSVRVSSTQASLKGNAPILADVIGPRTAAKTSVLDYFAPPAGPARSLTVTRVNPPTSKLPTEKLKARMKMRENPNSTMFPYIKPRAPPISRTTRSVTQKKIRSRSASVGPRETVHDGGAGPASVASNFSAASSSAVAVVLESGLFASSATEPNMPNSSVEQVTAPPSAPSMSDALAPPSIPPDEPIFTSDSVITSHEPSEPGPSTAPTSPAKPKAISPSKPPSTPSTRAARPTTRTRSTLMSPTKASLARAAATIIPASSVAALSRPKTGPILATFRGSSSLTNLSNALEKLNAPRPVRPNSTLSARPSTSMGFSQDSAESTDSMEQGKGRSMDDSQVGREGKSTGLGVGRKPEGGLKRAVTLGSEFFQSSQPEALSGAASTSENLLSASAITPEALATTSKPALRGGGQRSLAAWMSAGSKAQTANRGDGQPTSRIFIPGTKSTGSRLPTSAFASGMGRGGRKVSRNPGLPSVMASPLKGSGLDIVEDPEDEVPLEEPDFLIEEDPSPGPSLVGDSGSVFGGKGDAKDSRRGAWLKDTFRRASLASQALSQSLIEVQKEVVKGSMGPPPVPPGKEDTSSTETSPAATATSRPLRSSSRISAAVANAKIASASSKDANQSTGGDAPPKEVKKPVTLNVLKNCIVFVDVRTDDGDDAGGLFVQMLRDMGARTLARVGQTCTHIVFKNGLLSTLTRYRLLNDPKPKVVGIAWVVECVEQRQRVDEERFNIDLEGVNLAGINKRRRSMLPKAISARYEPGEISSSVGDQEETDVSSVTSVDDLPPLEKARLRKGILPSGR